MRERRRKPLVEKISTLRHRMPSREFSACSVRSRPRPRRRAFCPLCPYGCLPCLACRDGNRFSSARAVFGSSGDAFPFSSPKEGENRSCRAVRSPSGFFSVAGSVKTAAFLRRPAINVRAPPERSSDGARDGCLCRCRYFFVYCCISLAMYFPTMSNSRFTVVPTRNVWKFVCSCV